MAKKESDSKIVEQAQKHFALSLSAESQGRVERLDDIKFVRLGDQWPEAVKRDRERPGRERPCLTINRLFQFRNQVINEIRQNRPSIKVRPVDDNADIDTAEVIQGLIRHIQDASNAEVAYDTAAEWQVDTGLGYFRIFTGYCDDDSFDLDIKIGRIHDPNKVYFDPESTAVDGSDARWAFVVEEWNREDFEKDYPDVDVTGWDKGGAGDASGWYGKETARVAEYFVIEKQPKTLALLQDGTVVDKQEIPEEAQHLIVKERKSEVKTCKWYTIAGDQQLEATELPTTFIPIIPVLGSEVWVEGRRHLHGLTRHAKDPARLYNYMQSANTETLALAPKAPFIGAVGQFESTQHEWASANSINLPYLEYDPIDVMGTVLPAPQRQQGPSTNPGFEAAMMRSIDDMKSTMGIFDASLGNRESDQSGKAILSQQRQASIGNFHFSDNLARSIRQAGRIIVEMIPKIYDTARVARIIGEDGTPKNIKLDPQQQGAKAEQQSENGEIQSIYNLGVGKYDVSVDVGPSYATKRQEAAESMVQMSQSDPSLMQIAGDLIIKNMDWPEADEIAKRKKAMLPPQILETLKDENKSEDPVVAQMMNQMADQVQHLSQELQAATSAKQIKDEELEIKRFEAQTKRLEVEHKIALESTGLFHEMAIAGMTQTLQEPNDGEAENPDEQHDQQEIQNPSEMMQTTPGGAQSE